MVELLKPNEIDELLRYRLGKAERLARRGKLPHIVLPDGTIRFRKDEIEHLLESRAERESPEASHE